MRNTYQQIQRRLDRIDFNQIYEGFHPFPFAIYNQKQVCLQDEIVSKDEKYFGNTAIPFEGSYLAIWNIEMSPIEDYDLLTSKIVHEMFHAFQNEQGEKRSPNEIKALAIPIEEENIVRKFRENQQLLVCLASNNKESFQTFLKMRAWRKVLFEESFDFEMRTEMNEGTAQYIEWCALKQISEELYKESIAKAKARLINTALYKNLRHICYDSGALLGILLDELQYFWKYPIQDNPVVLMDSLLEYIIPEACGYEPYQELEEMVQSLNATRRITIKKTLQNAVLIEGPFQLMGLDPMSAFQVENQIYNPFFFGYLSAGHPKIIQGESVVELNEDFTIQRIYCKPE